MRFRMFLLISTVLAIAPLVACEVHAEAGSPPATPATPAAPATPADPQAAATPATPAPATTTSTTTQRMMGHGTHQVSRDAIPLDGGS